MEWLNMLDPKFRLDTNKDAKKIKKLERLRASYNIPDEVFAMRIIGTYWATEQIQRNAYDLAKRMNPRASDKEIFREIIMSRTKNRIPFGLDMNEEEVDKAVESINSMDDLVDFILSKESEEASEEPPWPDPFGITSKIEEILTNLETESHKQTDESIDRKETPFFHIPFAVDLMGKSVNQVLEQCSAFDAKLLPADDLFDDLLGVDPDFDKHFKLFSASLGFHGYFKLQDYQAFSFVGINFANDVAVECIVSLGRPVNIERYSSGLEVLKVFARSLENLYHNGRVQEHGRFGWVYTWKKDNNVISFVPYPPSGPTRTGILLSVQIRDTQLHPQGSELELLYNEAKKRVANLKF